MSGEVQRISGEQGEVRAKFFYQIKTSELKQKRGRLDYWVDLEAASNSYIPAIRRQAISVSQVEYNNHWERWLQIFTKDCHDIWKHENQPTFAWHLSVGLGSIFFGTFIFSVKSTTIRRGPRTSGILPGSKMFAKIPPKRASFLTSKGQKVHWTSITLTNYVIILNHSHNT